ncbi:hypothetical protein [Streptomyces fulvoviolaceus]|uniref:hypothetical protein n=1 Tax=Streptomyces fulvoviolaceus TaxID=285535 RepID=UPI0004C5A658|nr:hypothetical protein [Streptomyces fulvoviolaceus]MCT9076487.1 hypothetical protein [Streptomyces fulvoviolaceus]
MTRILTRTALAATAALLTAACSTAAGSTVGGRSGEGLPAPVTAARLTYGLPDDPVRMVLPATGAETRWTQGLDVFGQQVARTVAADCARDLGIGLTEEVPPAFISFADLPDLDFLGRHGFGHGAEVPTPAASPAPSRSGTSAEIRRCRAEGAAAAEEVRDAYLPLQQKWFGELAAVRSDPAATRALSGLPDCLAEQGYRARDENAFFALVDNRLMNAPSADFPRVDSELGHAYAVCMRPVEAVREPARLRLRERFLTEHAEEVGELRTTLVPALRGAEKRYGVRLAFPAP